MNKININNFLLSANKVKIPFNTEQLFWCFRKKSAELQSAWREEINRRFQFDSFGCLKYCDFQITIDDLEGTLLRRHGPKNFYEQLRKQPVQNVFKKLQQKIGSIKNFTENLKLEKDTCVKNHSFW